MTLRFIKKVTKEGTRKVLNIPKKLEDKVEVGDDMLITKLNLEELEETK